MGTAEPMQSEQTVLNRGLRAVKRVPRYVRRSFLLMAATFGLVMTAFGGLVLAPLGNPAFAGILGASGLAIFFFDVMWFTVYKLGVWYYA